MKNLRLAFLALFTLFATLTFADPLGTGFTYQGDLKLLGEPANGNFDFRFDLFDVEADGTEVATSVELSDVPVIDGIFSVELDFGSAPFGAKQQLWLQVAVREMGSIDERTVLNPRQKLTATPFALVSLGHEHDVAANNTRVGKEALTNVTTGYENTAVGTTALKNDTEGFYNTAVGFDALPYNLTGNANTAIGRRAMYNNTFGTGNTAVGSRTLHNNITGIQNTAVGASALLNSEEGVSNTAIGTSALQNTVSGNWNTAVGAGALSSNSTGERNTGIGRAAIGNNVDGIRNTSIGDRSLQDCRSGNHNTAIGDSTLRFNTSGNNNVAVGFEAGISLIAGDYNIVIGNSGVAEESQTTRIGNSDQTRTFISGINGITTDIDGAVAVVIDSNGQLGTISSSRLHKQDIEDMAAASSKVLELRPVTFQYKKRFQDGSMPTQYGLIAEEVAELFPGLVAFGKEGEPEAVKYHVLPALLLNEVKKQAQQIDDQQAQIETLQKQIAEITALVTGTHQKLAYTDAQ